MAGERPFWGWNGQLSCSDTVATDLVEHLMNAASWAAKEFPGAPAEVLARHAASVLGFGLTGNHDAMRAFTETATCAECASVLDDLGNCPRAPGFRSSEEQHGATLAAHCGARLWEDMAAMSKRLWIERAKRLRKRWSVDGMVEQLNADTDGNLALREACSPEPEWKEPTMTLQSAAACIIRRLRRDRDDMSLQFGYLSGEVCAEKEWRESTAGTHVADVVLRVIRRLRSSSNEATERVEARRSAILAAIKLVATWEAHGLAGIASNIYDLRAALEKTK